MITETALPAWAAGHCVIAVGGQTARPVDDAAFLTQAGGWVMVQAKKGLELSGKKDSELASALRQLVRVVGEGVPASVDGSGAFRALDPRVDRVVILVDERVSRKIKIALAEVTDRLRTLPDAVPIEEVATNADEREALEVLRGHCHGIWHEAHGALLTDGDFRTLMRPLVVRALDLRQEGADFRSVVPAILDLLESPDRLSDLWSQLAQLASNLSSKQSWIRHPDAVDRLEAEGIYLRPVARLRKDVSRLRQITAAGIAAPLSSIAITTPEGPLELDRDVLSGLLKSNGNIAVTGEPGVGKSVILHRTAQTAGDSADVVFVTALQILGTPGSTRSELNLDHDLLDVLLGWTGSRPGLLILDGIDQTRGLDASDWLPSLVDRLQNSRWRVIASIRLFDLRHGPGWQSMFRGTPPDPNRVDSALGQVSHIVVEDLTADEMADLTSRSPSLAALLSAHADPRLSAILSNPFNLHLAGQLLCDGATDIAAVRTRLDLLHRYWKSRVARDDPAGLRQRTIDGLVQAMVHQRTQHVADSAVSDSTLLATVPALLSNGILHEGPRSAFALTRVLTFAHPVLFDFAAAHVALGDVNRADSLAQALDVDPDLVMVLRPSMDYRLAIAWYNDPSRHTYWRLALRLSAEPNGHVLAAAAAAAVAAREMRLVDDLDELTTACLTLSPSTPAGREARQLAGLLAEAVGSGLPPDPGVLNSIGGMCAVLVRHAVLSDDVDAAFLAARLAGTAGKGQRLPDQAARLWVEIAEGATEVALRDLADQRRVQLVDVASAVVMIATKHEARAMATTVRRSISAPVLSAVGTRTVRQLVDLMGHIAAQDPDLAVDVGASVWRVEADREQATPLFESLIFSLRSNRAQELEGVQYMVGARFGALVEADAYAAAQLLVKIVQDRPSRYSDVEAPATGKPRVRYGEDLRFIGGHDAVPAMCDTLLARLRSGSPSPLLSDVVDLLMSQLTHADLWTRLLHGAADAESVELAQALEPALANGALLSHGETWQAAGRVAARLSPTLDHVRHEALETVIFSATEPALDDTEHQRGRLEQRRDTLLHSLGDAVVGPQSRLHLNAMASSGRTVYPLPSTTFDEDTMLFERGPDDIDPSVTSSPRRALLARVSDGLSRVAQSDQRVEARQRLLLAWPDLMALPPATLVSDPMFTNFLRVAHQVAYLSEVGPDTGIGDQVFIILESTLPTPVDPTAAREVRSEDLPGWTPTPASEAISGLRVLISRPDWREARGEQLRTLLKPFLDSPVWLYRLLSTEAISALFVDEDLLRETEERLAAEPDHHIAARLVQALARHIPTRAAEVDRAFARLTSLPGSRLLYSSSSPEDEARSALADLVTSRLTELALIHETPFALTIVREWLSQPLLSPHAAGTVAGVLRHFMTSTDTPPLDLQRRVFELLSLATASLRESARQMNASRTEDRDLDNVINLAKTAEHFAQQIYFASGATGKSTTVQDGSLGWLADQILPLLTDLSEVHHPAVTHHIMQTVFHLNPSRPKPTLLLARQVVLADPPYANEPLGLDATLQMVKACVADHRTMMINDPACTSALRDLLGVYVRVGWPAAVRMAETMDEFFR